MGDLVPPSEEHGALPVHSKSPAMIPASFEGGARTAPKSIALRSTHHDTLPPDALPWMLIVAVVVVGAWFLTLDARHLLHADEGRYAEIAREMFASGDWVTPRYNGLKYFEKPPFHLWMTALAYQTFGIGEWQARLWVALSGAAGVGVTALAGARWYGLRVGLLTALVLIATPAWNLGSHFNSLDMSVSGALACVLAGVLMAQHPSATDRARRNWMWFAWTTVAIAVLTKGLIGIVLPGLALVVYSLAVRDWALWRRLHAVSGAVLMLLIAVPWFVWVSRRNPEFPAFFFVHEHLQRYLSNVHHRSGPWWYFVPQVLMGFLPWLGLAPWMAAAAKSDRRGQEFRPAAFLAIWAASIFVFFSLSGSKLPGYILPIYPALAVLAALALDKLSFDQWNRLLVGAIIVLLAGLVGTRYLAHLGSAATPNALYQVFALWAAAACAVALIGVVVARWLCSGDRFRSIAVYSLALFAASTVALRGHETFGRASSGVDLVAPIDAVLRPGMPIYSVRLLDHTLPFYLRRTTTMVEAPDELEFGVQQEPQKWLPTMAAFLDRWATGPKAIAVMSHATFAELKAKNVVMVPVAEDFRRVVVANFDRGAP